LLHFTDRCSAKSPHNRAGSVPQKAPSSRAAFQMPNDRLAFRLRFRVGRFAPAPFPPSLRLRFTFPFAEPQAEALNLVIALSEFQFYKFIEATKMTNFGEGRNRTRTGSFSKTHYSAITTPPPEANSLITNEHQ